ncbi:glycosyltransferase [Thalassomonas sp. M1454]|uniref:glycosyltransferase n=1 Tax=Thalassomonas sp. M1454 TaxID=2594477 RepID=UPI00117D2F33|nr:glycosyltransferase family 2 protein [Thalassomonas sp. M1454]TRX55700.1 glycosyltransferase family 2 protein [Thalassomonas sp. M1454]
MKISLSLLQRLPLLVLFSITFIVFYLALTTEKVAAPIFNDARLILFLLLLPMLFRYVLQLLLLPIYSVLSRKISANVNKIEPLSVTVLIPAYNEEVGIIKTLQSVIDTQYPKLEIIVINDGSTDKTHQLMTNYIEHQTPSLNSNIQLHYLALTNGGKSNALNQALKVASNDIVMTIDGDCIMDPNAIKNTVKQFSCDKVGAVAGNVVIGNKSKPIEVIQQLEYLCGFFLRRADSVLNSVFIIGGAAAAYRRKVLTEVGFFNSEIVTEDIEMSTRILAAGYKTKFASDAITYTEGPSSWKGLFEQRLRWKFGRFQTFIKYKELFFSKQKHHSKYLTWLVFPVAVYAEFILLLEALIVVAFFAITFYSNDYLPLALLISFMTVMITIQVHAHYKSRFHRNLLLLAPVAWLLFYVVEVVEFQALCRSIKRLVKKQSLQWQKWVRVGL